MADYTNYFKMPKKYYSLEAISKYIEDNPKSKIAHKAHVLYFDRYLKKEISTILYVGVYCKDDIGYIVIAGSNKNDEIEHNYTAFLNSDYPSQYNTEEYEMALYFKTLTIEARRNKEQKIYLNITPI